MLTWITTLFRRRNSSGRKFALEDRDYAWEADRAV